MVGELIKDTLILEEDDSKYILASLRKELTKGMLMMPKVFACKQMESMTTFFSCKTIITFDLTSRMWECALHIGPMAKGHDVEA